MILVTYDVDTTTPSGKKRLSKIAKLCCNHGQRVQNSVFECDLEAAALVTFRAELLKIMDKSKDSLRIYNLGNNYTSRTEQYGSKQSFDPEGELIM